ncbi:ORF3 [Atractylodes mild mottle virus]|uniref:Virion-associated protein n=1 Tax=Atractylodes mild mottle virus TaxID=1711685 RepID=A0A0M5K7P9_9VIRU|nr:ORF3 [Atractylodes mild mottle virus]ALD49088.1 ORF3 [Atractylodes mild mottle virus]
MSLKEVSEVLEKIKKLVEQTEALLEKSKEIVEASAAKVINDITAKLEKCQCNKEILDALKEIKGEPSKELAVTGKDDPKGKSKSFPLEKYSFPNYRVGNAELGSSGNPNAVVYPPEPWSK